MIDRRLDVLLRAMRDAACMATTFVGPISSESLLADRLTQNAVAMSLLRLGESATKILQDHPDFALSHPQIRWASMRGVRNLIAHAYDEIDFVILWRIVADHLPSLIDWLDVILNTD